MAAQRRVEARRRAPDKTFAISEVTLADLFAISEYCGMALLLSPASVKALRSMPKREREQLQARLTAIAAAPADRHPSVTAMQGAPAGRFRVRQGDWRAIFTVVDGDVAVLAIGHRREVYE